MKTHSRPVLVLLLLSLFLLVSGFMLVLFIVLDMIPSTFFWNGLAFVLSSIGLWLGIGVAARIAGKYRHGGGS